jgi:inward rectifier potassium channel
MSIEQIGSTFQREGEGEDAGFGTQVEPGTGRLIDHAGVFRVERTGTGWLAAFSPYHLLITMNWLRFHLVVLSAYLVTNVLFALAYLALGPQSLNPAPGAPWGQFLNAFFFSAQTLTTVGYGHISPGSTAAAVLAAMESLVGLMSFALATGILFARFSRPRARILFADQALVRPFRDGQALMVRLVNARSNQLIETRARLLLSSLQQRPEGPVRVYEDLPLDRSHVSLLPLDWTLVHRIDKDSPLAGITQEELELEQAELFVLFQGFDETFSQTIHARCSYRFNEITWGRKFVPMHHPAPDGRMRLDVSLLSRTEVALEPVPPARPEALDPYAHQL